MSVIVLVRFFFIVVSLIDFLQSFAETNRDNWTKTAGMNRWQLPYYNSDRNIQWKFL